MALVMQPHASKVTDDKMELRAEKDKADREYLANLPNPSLWPDLEECMFRWSDATYPAEQLKPELSGCRIGIVPRIPDRVRLFPPEWFHETHPDLRKRELVYGILSDDCGPNSATVKLRFAQSCCGWPTAPTSQEFFHALRSDPLTIRQKSVIAAWAREATPGEIVRCWLEEVYTWPLLVTSLHRSECTKVYRLNRMLNGFADPALMPADRRRQFPLE